MEELIAVRGARYARRRVLDWIAEVGRVAMMLGDALRLRERLAHQPPTPQRQRPGDAGVVLDGLAHPLDHEVGVSGIHE